MFSMVISVISEVISVDFGDFGKSCYPEVRNGSYTAWERERTYVPEMSRNNETCLQRSFRINSYPTAKIYFT